MRTILISLIVLATGTAVAQQKSAVPPELLSPTLLGGWQVQPAPPSAGEEVQLAWRWAQEPSDLWAENSKSPATPSGTDRSQRSTVGQGSE
jgi:hypothetical protein